MDAANRNTLWADIFVEELARSGLEAACIAPGSRSTPLTMALARHPRLKVYSLLDERGAAFFALGLALASGKPAAVVCTSGSATANFYPAIIEADSAHVPLLVLTTDRPPELRHSGANQTIDQLKLYGDHVRWFVDVALPEANPAPTVVRSLRTLAARAVAATMGLPPGPVHLNFPFRKPLEPTPVPGDVPDKMIVPARPEDAPYTRLTRGRLQLDQVQISALVDVIRQAPRGLIVCGPRCPGGDFPEAVTRLARTSGYPILADALSGLRFGSHTATAGVTTLGGYETFLQPEIFARWEPPDLILRFGAMPIAAKLGQYLGAHHHCRHIQFSGNGVWQDDTHTTGDFIWADPSQTAAMLADRLANLKRPPADEAWPARFCQAEQQVWQTIEKFQAEDFFEGTILTEIVGLMPHSADLFVASSLPVRHLDQFVGPNMVDLRVFANRGASGIDGTIASALGVAAASNRPLVLVIGDLAFYHDLNSLLALQRCQVQATIVLINNNGGGIFHRLPVANFEPPFTGLFLTPHGLDFEPAVRMFGVDFARAPDRETFRRLFRQSLAGGVSRVIEVSTDSRQHEQVRRRIIEAVVRELTTDA